MSGTGFTILLVEDEELLRNLITNILENDGFKVLKASHGDEALVKLDEYPDTVHLLLTDLHMDPFLDGFELAKCTRMLRPRIAVLYISGMTRNIMVDQEVEEGRAFFLVKPFTAQVLIEKVHSVIELSLKSQPFTAD